MGDMGAPIGEPMGDMGAGVGSGAAIIGAGAAPATGGATPTIVPFSLLAAGGAAPALTGPARGLAAAGGPGVGSGAPG